MSDMYIHETEHESKDFSFCLGQKDVVEVILCTKIYTLYIFMQGILDGSLEQ